jgi:uncharacterized protein YdeI (YjbR/CyaY-like superfamily)
VAEDLEELLAIDAAAWLRWLSRNHAKASGVWLVLAKKGFTEPTSLTYDQALEVALCHGWIDGQVRRRDESTFRQRFTPRRARSPWSKRNVAIAEQLIAAGRMQAAGLLAVEQARADGRWQAAYAGAATIEIPADLIQALERQPRAQATFALLSGQNRYAILYRINAAKRPDTRARRIERFVAMLASGETIYPQRQTIDPGSAGDRNQLGRADAT